MGMHAENRARLLAALRTAGVPPSAGVLLQGGAAPMRHETDHEPLFRQESMFHWAFGVREPDFYGIIDVDTGHATLFVPRLPPSYAIIMGAIKTCAEWQAIYGVDAVWYVDELPTRAQGNEADGPRTLLVLNGVNTDSKNSAVPADFPGLRTGDSARHFKVDDSSTLWDAIVECRVFKSPKELDLLRYSATVSSEAHLAVMQHTRPGLSEYQLESLFRHWCYYVGGARQLSYTCICASGHNGSVLHYGHAGEPNAKLIRDGDLCLFDMGCEFHCYGSDITTTFPANGVFTADQRIIYEAVLAAAVGVMDAMQPGIVWTDMHTLANRILLTKLRDGGLLVGDVDAMLAVNLGATFMPHGLGHFLGIDTHDSGGYALGSPPRPALPGYASLRTARTLRAGMYITVEPGCYFINHLIAAATADPARAVFLVPEVIARFAGTGGVRIEEDVLVTETGCENFSRVPRTIADIEAVMAGKITSIGQLTKFH